ncbi:MAG: hypothetical protein GY769_04355 [bacterium]|nr:hypothetical protein [bacterium]
MICQKTGREHDDFDFDGAGLSTTGCDCRDETKAEDMSATPTECGPEGAESYEEPEGDAPGTA